MRTAKALAPCLLWLSMQAVASEDARDYLKFAASYEADCVMLQGEMRQLLNKHPKRPIAVYLYRQVGDTQQPGRREETVPPGGKPINLGCTRVPGGITQDWDIVEARFGH
jgi:hypothetical protein